MKVHRRSIPESKKPHHNDIRTRNVQNSSSVVWYNPMAQFSAFGTYVRLWSDHTCTVPGAEIRQRPIASGTTLGFGGGAEDGDEEEEEEGEEAEEPYVRACDGVRTSA